MRFDIPYRLGHVLEETENGPVLYLCPLPSGPITALTGSGAVIWLHAVEEERDVAEVVAADYGVAIDTVQDEVKSFLDYLLEAGFLERAS